MTIPFDTTKPNMARMYDYWLGGKDNFEADRKAAEAVRELRPNIAEQAFDNKKFLTRAVSYVAAQGVRQFLDVGSGLPTSPVVADGAAPLWRATHEAAQAVIPDAMVAYVDGARIYAHSWDEISALFDGLELVPPGLVETSAWQPGLPFRAREEQASMIVAGVGRRP